MNWKTINSKNEGPAGRWGHTSIALDDKLYIFGGYGINLQIMIKMAITSMIFIIMTLIIIYGN